MGGETQQAMGWSGRGASLSDAAEAKEQTISEAGLWARVEFGCQLEGEWKKQVLTAGW